MSKNNKENESKQSQFAMENKNGFELIKESDKKSINSFAEDYKKFLNHSRTERLAVSFAIEEAKKAGFTEYDSTKSYKENDKIYYNNRGKAIILAVIGKKSIDNGAHIVASHIDSPRLDLKPNPLYEDKELALGKTHYYGGIKKYQWVALPLALHGVVVKLDGTKVNISVGEDENDMQFCITDLLPHLGDEQMKKPATKVVEGEQLCVLLGSEPLEGASKDKVKANILQILNDKYGIVEEDFISAELSLTPAVKTVDVGFDRSLIGGYGQDDRVCSYPNLAAILKCDKPEYTSICVLADKEEIGSMGNTGLNSAFLRQFVECLAHQENVCPIKSIQNSNCLSADVTAAFDPLYPSVFDAANSCYLNHGVSIMKYTGARGKAGTSDASAEFMGYVRRLLADNDIIWQTGELGKVDAGGGGTVAMFVANLGMDVVDIGVPVLSMHSPFEISSKLDIYMLYKTFCAYFS